MDFLTGLYSNSNFGIILFTSISILVIVFLVILFFGKKDKKETKQKEIIEDSSSTNSEVAFQSTDNTASVEAPVNLTDAVPHPEEIQINSVEPEILDKENNTNTEVEESSPIPPKTDFDFDALAASISKELESIGVTSTEQEDATNDINQEEEDSIPTEELTIEDSEPSEEMETISNSETTIPNVAQFSSVFVSNNEEKPEEIAPEVIPTNPRMEMPKPMELPKLNSEVTPKPEPIILENVPDNFFPGIDEDNSEQNRM